MDSSVVLRLQSVFPFIPTRRDYSGSAVALEEEAVQATFSSPPRCRTVSPVAYGFGLPTVGRRRASPVMAWDHFLQAAARITQLVRSRQSAEPAVGREVRSLVGASSKGGEWRTKQAENAVSQSHLAWPLRHATFSGKPGGDALAAYLHVSRGVRARRSVRVRSRTGRLRRSVLSSFHRLTISSRGKLSPEPLRLTRPFRAR
jgi:hypothetical protein